MHPESPEFLQDTLHIITIIAIPIHIFGTYCILFKTPKTMGSVKWIMFNFHFWCMFLDYGVTILAVPFMIFPALAGFPLGILREINCPMEIQAYLILTLLAVVSAAIITIFENRYYIVFAQNTKWQRYRILVSIINYSYAFVWCLPSFITVPEQTMARKVALKMLGPNVPDYIINAPLYVISLEMKYITLPCFVIIMIIVPQAFIFVGLIKRGLKRLKETARFSETTLKMQRNFLHAVYIQVSLYMTVIQLPIVYVFSSVLFKFHNQAANNICFVIFSFNGVSSTLIMIWIHTPYRDFCYKLLGIEKWRQKRKSTVKASSCETAITVVPPAVS